MTRNHKSRASLREAQRRGHPVRIASLALAMAVMVSSPAVAQDTAGFFSGRYLLQLCQSDAKGREILKGGHTACQSYIAGVIDYHKLMKTLGTAPTIDFCVPNTEPMERLQLIVWKYLVENGQHSQFVAAPAVTLALYEYYPCIEKKKPSTRRRR
jgi:hypothetical protein